MFTFFYTVTTDISLDTAPPHTHVSLAIVNFGEENIIHCPGEQQIQIVRQCIYMLVTLGLCFLNCKPDL